MHTANACRTQSCPTDTAQVHRDWLLQRNDNCICCNVPATEIAVNRVGIEINSIARLEMVGRLTMPYGERAGEEVKKLAAKMLMGARFTASLWRQKLRKVRIELTIRNEVTEALKEVRRLFHTRLGQTNSILLAMDAEESLGLWIEEVAQVL